MEHGENINTCQRSALKDAPMHPSGALHLLHSPLSAHSRAWGREASKLLELEHVYVCVCVGGAWWEGQMSPCVAFLHQGLSREEAGL